MTTINKLSAYDTLVAGDVVPVHITEAADTRKVAFSTILEFIQDNFDLTNAQLAAVLVLLADVAASLEDEDQLVMLSNGTGAVQKLTPAVLMTYLVSQGFFQTGIDLDLGTKKIISDTDTDIEIAPGGSGTVKVTVSGGTYTIPTTLPAGADYYLRCGTDGVMYWSAT